MAKGNRRVKLLFDETIGEPIARAAIDFLNWDKSCEIDAQFMRSFMGEGTGDSEWVPRAAAERRFVITGDRGKSSRSAPLDLLLPYLGVSGVFMTGALHESKQFQRMRAVITLWPHIVEAAAGRPATRYRMRIDRERASFAWAEWPLNDKAIRRQAELFKKIPHSLWEG